jgi:BT1 family
VVSLTVSLTPRHYKMVNYFIAMYSGSLMLFVLPNNTYIKTTLKKDGAAYTQFQTVTQSAWILKPLLGFLSDTIYPFKSRTRFYLICFPVIQIIVSLVLIIFLDEDATSSNEDSPNKNYNFLTFVMVALYFCTGFADALA